MTFLKKLKTLITLIILLKKYQKRTGATLKEILAASPQEILKKSRYNP